MICVDACTSMTRDGALREGSPEDGSAGAELVVIVERLDGHSGSGPSSIRECDSARILAAGDLHRAGRLAATATANPVGGERVSLLDIDTRSGDAAVACGQPRTQHAFRLPLNGHYVASLIHDAWLLGIAAGGVVTVDDDVDVSAFWRCLRASLAARGGHTVIHTVAAGARR